MQGRTTKRKETKKSKEQQRKAMESKEKQG